MAEVIERVAKLEERFEGLTAGITDIRVSIRDLDARMQADFRDVRAEMDRGFSDVRAEMRQGVSELRTEMHTQFRWVMGGIGGAVMAILLAIAANGWLTR